MDDLEFLKKLADCNDKEQMARCIENHKPMTNAQKIRAMSDEEMAATMYGLVDLDERIHFCQNKAECDAILATDECVPQQNCVRCLLEWLKQPAEEVNKDA